jgi:hypothetical protein
MKKTTITITPFRKKDPILLAYEDEYIDPSDLVKQQCTDAQLWAKSFMDTKKKMNWTEEDIDEGLMISWFANAIVVAEDKIHHDINEAKLSEYECNWCNTIQKFKSEDLERKQIGDRMASGLFGLCISCNKEHIMIPMDQHDV